MADYGWIITKDHLFEQFGGDDETGTMGPRDIPDAIKAQLQAGKGHTFRMYDDDGELYYTGRAIGEEGTEEFCYGPLGDYGGPNAGCTLIKWHGHKEWDCG